MEVIFIGEVHLNLEVNEGDTTSKLKSTDFALRVSENIDRERYLNGENLPTEEGTKMLTMTLVSGLAGNIHAAHANGQWDSAKHLRFAIAELEKQFAMVTDVEKSFFKRTNKDS